jgi:hypothetical protein
MTSEKFPMTVTKKRVSATVRTTTKIGGRCACDADDMNATPEIIEAVTLSEVARFTTNTERKSPPFLAIAFRKLVKSV